MPFASGVLLSALAAPPLAACLAACAAATAFALLSLKRKRLPAATRSIVFAFACAGAALGVIEARPGASGVRAFYESGKLRSGDPVELTGVMERAPEEAPDGLALSLRVESLRHGAREERATGRVELFATVEGERARKLYESLELRRGARLRVMTALRRAERFRNPGVATVAERLDRRGVSASGSVKSPLLVERLDDEPVFLPLVWLDDWRARLVRAADETFSPPTAGVFKAAFLGNRRGLTRETAGAFREGGTFHVLVISGLHITFLGGLAWWAARRLTRRRLLQWAASVACVWLYSVGVGAETSVVRAALMFTAAALAPALGRRSASLNALGGAALALLAWRPSSLFDPSFQLTFLSALAIVALALPLLSNMKAAGEWRPSRAAPRPPEAPAWLLALSEALYWRERRWRREMARSTHSYKLFKSRWAARLGRFGAQAPLRFAFAALVVTASVQLALLPLSVLYFHRLALASLALNAYTGALMALLAASSCAALALSAASAQLASPFVWTAETATRMMAGGVKPFASAGVAGLRLPEYSGAAAAVYALYFVPLIVIARALLNWRPVGDGPPIKNERPRRARALKLASVALVIMLVVIIAHPSSAGGSGGRLRVDFLDVGQGDAALITTPDGTTLLVDGGGRPRFAGDDDGEAFEPDVRGVGDSVVSEYLWWRGLSRVNYLFATHADADHAEGLGDVARNF
ncbi:MAG TPA: ComEC/Rec2 family competence protein, partial [Pyrinomonadaceae bacterium]|nr:ComEC/Rec2 family competence protein [Pyrinomonadaceae bacterium]